MLIFFTIIITINYIFNFFLFNTFQLQLSIPPLLFLHSFTLPQIDSLSISFKKRSDFPGIVTKNSIRKYNNSRHNPNIKNVLGTPVGEKIFQEQI